MLVRLRSLWCCGLSSHSSFPSQITNLLPPSFEKHYSLTVRYSDLEQQELASINGSLPWSAPPMIDVYSFKDAQVIDRIQLHPFIFSAPIRPDILHQAVVWHRASQRQGTHQAKTVGMTNHSTRKILRQKGSGRARHGHNRAPQFKGGGVVFPPSPRDYSYPLPLKVRRLALRSALTSKLVEGRLIIVQDISLESHKVREFQNILLQNGYIWKKETRSELLTSILISPQPKFDKNLRLASRVLKNVTVIPSPGLSVYDILRHNTLILSLSSLQELTQRLLKDWFPSYHEVNKE
jgi:large subunit ribosomal protein L4